MATVKIDQTTTYHEPYASGEFGSVYLDWAIPRQPLLVGFRKTTKRKFSVKVRIIHAQLPRKEVIGTYSNLFSTGSDCARSRAKSLRHRREHSIRHFPYSLADSK